MKADTPIVLAAARYGNREDAVFDFKTVWGAKTLGEFDHTAVAVLTKEEDGNLRVERHDTTAKHMAWVGAALVVIAPPAGAAARPIGPDHADAGQEAGGAPRVGPGGGRIAAPAGV